MRGISRGREQRSTAASVNPFARADAGSRASAAAVRLRANTPTAAETAAEGPAAPEKTPLALLEEFYEAQNGRPLAPQQRDFARALIEKIWEEEP